MRRRAVLTTGATLTSAALAGCLTEMVGGSAADDAVLDPPDDEHANASDSVYPTYGDPFPAFELTDPLAETPVDTDAIDDECLICTAFYATCPAECIPLMNAIVDVQGESIERGVDDAVRFLSITFDPERDTPDELREHAEWVDVDLEVGNWHYLRPDDTDEADSIVYDDLGIHYEREGDGPNAEFAHITVTFLVNPDGYVERSYRGDSPDVDRISSDLETVVDAME